MKYADIKGLSEGEIQDKLKEETEALQKMKFAHAISAIENPMQIRARRKVIAKLNTELNARRNEK